jgi:hypothetical protein
MFVFEEGDDAIEFSVGSHDHLCDPFKKLGRIPLVASLRASARQAA